MHSHSGGNAIPPGTTTTDDASAPAIGAIQVSHDMETIFEGADCYPAGKASATASSITPIVSRSSTDRLRNGRVLALTGLVIAGAVGISIGLAPRDIPDVSPRQFATPFSSLASQVDRVSRAPTSIQSVAGPAVPTGRASEAAAETSAGGQSSEQLAKPAVDVESYFKALDAGEYRRAYALMTAENQDATPAAVRFPSRPMTAENQDATPAAVKFPSGPKWAAHEPKLRPTQRLAVKSVLRAHRSRGTMSCNRMGGLDLARCMRPKILHADRQLRNAYYHAVRSGVDRRTLVAYRDQWSTLRRRANSDPRSVTVGFRRLAHQLEVTRTGRRAGDM
jgi:hypothetical protein